MPVTIKVSKKNAEPVNQKYHTIATSGKQFLKKVASSCADQCVDIIQYSLEKKAGTTLLPSTNGFVYSVTMAYNHHHNLTIRPEDVWLAILTQFSAYVNKHAEELRGQFVAHEGQKELKIEYDKASRYDVDMKDFAVKMGKEIAKNVTDKELRAWIMPSFTTTTLNDTVVASVVMMASMQKYFKYTMYTLCGIPNVTLEGCKEDWQDILLRLDKLKEWGEETTRFAEFLRPVIRKFIQSFDEPTSSETIDFWKHIVSYLSDGSGSNYYSGWITAFCFWGKDGQLLHATRPDYRFNDDENYRLDGVRYPRVDTQDVPPGWISVPVKVVELKQVYSTMMVAGSVGIQCERSEQAPDGDLNSVSPKIGWWMFEVDAPDDENAEPGSVTKVYRCMS
jgi:Domain of unknown function (DUF4419)